MIEHIHKVGVNTKKRSSNFLCECGKCFAYDEAMVYVERTLGDEAGRAYWNSLKALLARVQYLRKKHIELEEFLLPEDLKNLFPGPTTL